MYDNTATCVATTTNGVSDPCGAGHIQHPYGSDANTNYDDSLGAVNAQMPDPGNGTNAAGDSPQEVAVCRDRRRRRRVVGRQSIDRADQRRRRRKLLHRHQEQRNQDRDSLHDLLVVAIEPSTSNNVAPIESEIAPALQACASPGLFYQAGIDRQLIADFATLFQQLAVRIKRRRGRRRCAKSSETEKSRTASRRRARTASAIAGRRASGKADRCGDLQRRSSGRFPVRPRFPRHVRCAEALGWRTATDGG